MKTKFSITIFCILFLITSQALPEEGNDGKFKKFDYDVAAFPGSAVDRDSVRIYIWISNSNLQFVKADSHYAARYQINLEVYPKKGAAILTRDTTFVVQLQKYSDTIKKDALQRFQFLSELSPGKYQFRMRVVDLNSREVMVENAQKELPSFSGKEIVLSDILLLKSPDATFDAQNVLPPQRIPIHDQIFIFMRAFIPENISALSLAAYRRQQKETLIGEEKLSFASSLTNIVIPWKEDKMARGRCQLVLKLDGQNVHRKKVKNLAFFGSIKTLSDESLDVQIEQLKYVATGKEWSRLSKAKGEERRKLFNEFWEKRDPSPGTPENKLFDEYYKRVRIANEQFGDVGTAGWKTDRGHVFIIYGPPDQVQKNNEGMDQPGNYIIWYYQKLDKKFVFLDEQGFGNYRLVSGFFD